MARVNALAQQAWVGPVATLRQALDWRAGKLAENIFPENALNSTANPGLTCLPEGFVPNCSSAVAGLAPHSLPSGAKDLAGPLRDPDSPARGKVAYRDIL